MLFCAQNSDIFISTLDASGNFISTVRAGSIAEDRGYGIAVDNNCNVYATGFFRTTATFGTDTIMNAGARDIFVTKLVL